MPTTETLTVTFDGINDVPRLAGSSDVEWNGDTIDLYSLWYGGPKDKFVFNASLTGTNWKLKLLRPAGEDNMAVIKDIDAGAGREIRYLELGYNSDVELISTRARYVFGWDGDKHEVTLGNQQSGSTYSINLYALENVVTTGNAWVKYINNGGEGTGAGDTIVIGSGGVGAVRTWNRDDKVTADGWAGYIHTDGGDDEVVIGASGAGYVRTDEGNDKVTTGTGWVETISTGEGNDVVNLGTGGGAFVRLWDGNDTIRVSETAADTGVQIRGGKGSDTISFQNFTKGVTFSLDLDAAYQNVTNPGVNDGTTGSGLFAESWIENIIGSNKGDKLTGDAGVNKLIGKGGNDRLTGGDGNDKLDGGNGGDRLFGGNGKDNLIGGKGNDVLEGGKGNDTLRGNAGADVFVFGAGSGTDKVKDFADGVDALRISGHTGGFASLTISDQGGDLKIAHDGGVFLLLGEAGTTLTAADFDFV